MKKQILTVMMLATIFASCQKNEETPKVISKYINVEANIGSLTRATDTAFEDGDQISVYAWAGTDFDTSLAAPLIVNNSINTLAGATWSAAPQMLWKDMVTKHYFAATYPTLQIDNFTAQEFTLAGDQSANDLLFALSNTGLVGNDGASVPLTFEHSQSKINVNLTFRDQFVSPVVDKVTLLAKNTSMVDFTTQTTIVKADAIAAECVIPATTANVNFESVVVPQTINKITITIAGKDYIYNNTTGIALVQGKQQTLNLTVGRDVILVGNVIINEWETNSPPIDGEAGEKE